LAERITNVVECRGEAFKLHSTQKPLALIRLLVGAATTSGMLIIDPSAGVGTTNIACQQLGRGCIGIEDDAGVFAAGVARIQELNGFDGRLEPFSPRVIFPVRALAIAVLETIASPNCDLDCLLDARQEARPACHGEEVNRGMRIRFDALDGAAKRRWGSDLRRKEDTIEDTKCPMTTERYPRLGFEDTAGLL
jgi:hypothetical protein